METKNIYDKLSAIQLQLRVGKDLRNDFGGYNYRSAEQILAHLRAPVAAERCALTLTDELIEKCGRTYIKATATLVNCEDPSQVVSKDAYAAENIGKKGSDPAQVTGAASSYARKYALGGLFSIDDGSSDPDATNKHGRDAPLCADCGKPITSYSKRNGVEVSAADFAGFTFCYTDRHLCRSCWRKVNPQTKAAAKAAQAEQATTPAA